MAEIRVRALLARGIPGLKISKLYLNLLMHESRNPVFSWCQIISSPTTMGNNTPETASGGVKLGRMGHGHSSEESCKDFGQTHC